MSHNQFACTHKHTHNLYQKERVSSPTVLFIVLPSVLSIPLQIRFMQFQPNLTALGLARLELFRFVTLPSMEHQSNQRFLWTIRTDPDLHDTVKQPLLELLGNSSLKDRIVLIADNYNPSSFRYITNVTQNNTWFGPFESFQQQLHLARTGQKPVIETGLDADDALPTKFVERMQRTVHDKFQHPDSNPNDWWMWCSHWHWEWLTTGYNDDTALAPLAASSSSSLGDATPQRPRQRRKQTKDKYFGFLQRKEFSKCLTAGLTVAYSHNASRNDIPGKMVHTKVHEYLSDCDDATVPKNKNSDAGAYHQHGDNETLPRRTHCLHHSMYGKRKPAALRARTPTSTSMTRVAMHSHEDNNIYIADETAATTASYPQWDTVEREFGVSRGAAKRTKDYLLQHLLPIAIDNLNGHCTHGHSCKESTRRSLEAVVNGLIQQEESFKTTTKAATATETAIVEEQQT